MRAWNLGQTRGAETLAYLLSEYVVSPLPSFNSQRMAGLGPSLTPACSLLTPFLKANSRKYHVLYKIAQCIPLKI